MKITGASDEALCLYNGLQDSSEPEASDVTVFSTSFHFNSSFRFAFGGGGEYQEKILNLCPILHQ